MIITLDMAVKAFEDRILEMRCYLSEFDEPSCHNSGSFYVKWSVERAEHFYEYIISEFTPSAEIERNLIEDMPEDNELKKRLKYVYFELSHKDYYGKTYLDKFDEEIFSEGNKGFRDKLSSVYGEENGRKHLEKIVEIVRYFNRETDKVLGVLNNLTALAENRQAPQQVQASTRAKTFRDKIIAGNKEEFLNKLHSLIDGKRGKNVALVIVASVEMGLIQKPTYREMQREFGNIGAESGYHSYLNKDKFPRNEYEGIKERLSE